MYYAHTYIRTLLFYVNVLESKVKLVFHICILSSTCWDMDEGRGTTRKRKRERGKEKERARERERKRERELENSRGREIRRRGERRDAQSTGVVRTCTMRQRVTRRRCCRSKSPPTTTTTTTTTTTKRTTTRRYRRDLARETSI